ncbi:MAG: FtsB family cell division protein, partial [Acidimicrobiales bacterium]
FPLSALLTQHHQLSAAAAQLRQLQGTNRSLAEQQRQLNSTAAIGRLAREDYQMVSPGQTLYVVLPPGGRAGPTTTGGSTAGDPGSQPLVAPADAPDMSPDPGLSQQASATGSGSPGTAGGQVARAGSGPSGTTGAQSTTSFWGRVTNSLEFWK